VHNKGSRTGALTLSAFGVLEGEDVREGDGVCRLLLLEDMRDKSLAAGGDRLNLNLSHPRALSRPCSAPSLGQLVHSTTASSHISYIQYFILFATGQPTGSGYVISWFSCYRYTSHLVNIRY